MKIVVSSFMKGNNNYILLQFYGKYNVHNNSNSRMISNVYEVKPILLINHVEIKN